MKDRLIRMIGAASEQEDMLLDFMNLYNLDNLMDATIDQLKEYARNRGLL